MTIWTIAAQEGTGADQVAAELAARAGVPLLDRKTLARWAHELDPEAVEVADVEAIEERVGGRARMLGLGMAMLAGSSAVGALEIGFREKLPELGRAVFAEIARQPCVILSPAAVAVLAERPASIHVRLRAPTAARVAAYQRDHLVDRARAEKAIAHDDHAKRALVRSLYHVDIDDDRLFTIVLDASRFPTERLVEILLAAGGATPRSA